jgi:transposase
MKKLDRTDAPAAAEYATVYLAFELSKAKWKLGVLLPGSQKLSRYRIGGGDLAALAARLADMRKKAAAVVGGRCASCHATKQAWTAIGCTDG